MGESEPSTRGRVPLIPVWWQVFGFTVLMILVTPLLPLAFEWWHTGEISTASLVLTASIYAISILSASENPLIMGIALLAALGNAWNYPLFVEASEAMRPHESWTRRIAVASLLLIFVTHAFERYSRHVCDRKPLWELAPGWTR